MAGSTDGRASLALTAAAATGEHGCPIRQLT
jgi:hypothetical protein